MEDKMDHLYTQNSEVMQLPYDEYVALQEKIKEAVRVEEVKKSVLAQLQRMLNGDYDAEEIIPDEPAEEQVVESDPDTSQHGDDMESEPEPAPDPVQETAGAPRTEVSEAPPIKAEISDHFNRYDESGRLFNIFKQYYTCLNESCGGTVRVTMKDGFCSLWNYDEWEEFAFVDIHDGQLRIAVHPRYTDELKSLSLCQASRLISNRHNVVCVLVGDLNTTVLEILSRAFAEVGMQIG